MPTLVERSSTGPGAHHRSIPRAATPIGIDHASRAAKDARPDDLDEADLDELEPRAVSPDRDRQRLCRVGVGVFDLAVNATAVDAGPTRNVTSPGHRVPNLPDQTRADFCSRRGWTNPTLRSYPHGGNAQVCGPERESATARQRGRYVRRFLRHPRCPDVAASHSSRRRSGGDRCSGRVGVYADGRRPGTADLLDCPDRERGPHRDRAHHQQHRRHPL